MANAQLLNRFVQLHGTKVDATFEPTNNKGGALWICTLRVPGCPYEARAGGQNKKQAQEQATADFVEFLQSAGHLDNLPAPAKKQRVGPGGPSAAVQTQLPSFIAQRVAAINAAKAAAEQAASGQPIIDTRGAGELQQAAALAPIGSGADSLDFMAPGPCQRGFFPGLMMAAAAGVPAFSPLLQMQMQPQAQPQPQAQAQPLARTPLVTDSEYQQLLELLRRGQALEALAFVTGRMGQRPGCLAIHQAAKLLQNVAVRADPAAVSQFLDGVESMRLISFPDLPAREYFSRFARLTLLELLGSARSVLEQAGKVPARTLESAGACVPEMAAQAAKGGVELTLLCLSSRLPSGHQFVKGDWVFITFPHNGEVGAMSSPNATTGTFEAELVNILPEGAGMTVKLCGTTNEVVARLKGHTCRVDRAANRVTFCRQVDALKVLCMAQEYNMSHLGWLRKALVNGGHEVAVCSQSHLGVGAAEASPIWGQANHSQQEALRAALSRRITLIQGPPGSGKTHTAVLLVRLWISLGRKPVMASADSNVAVDNMLSGFVQAGLNTVRVGRPESTRPDLERYNLLERSRSAGVSFGDNWAEEKRALKSSEAVCCTCSGADHPIMQDSKFPSVVIDEAAQATEPAVLVSLLRLEPQLGAAVLIGDHKQLAPTVVDQECESAGLGLSLFTRLVMCGLEPIMLDTQYRMHPALAVFPSLHSYDGRLKSGVAGRKRKPPRGLEWPEPRAPIAFLHVEGKEIAEGTSFLNHQEANKVATLVKRALDAGDLGVDEIGIITPYKAQVRLLRRVLPNWRSSSRGGTSGSESGIEISSVDGFQGREKDLIIVSTVRANESGGVGFLADTRRLNVTLTRAKRGLVVVGNARTLTGDQFGWLPWLQWMQERGLVAGQPATDRAQAARLASLDSLDEDELQSTHGF